MTWWHQQQQQRQHICECVSRDISLSPFHQTRAHSKTALRFNHASPLRPFFRPPPPPPLLASPQFRPRKNNFPASRTRAHNPHVNIHAVSVCVMRACVFATQYILYYTQTQAQGIYHNKNAIKTMRSRHIVYVCNTIAAQPPSSPAAATTAAAAKVVNCCRRRCRWA